TFSGLTFTDTAAYQSFAPGSYTVKFVAAGTTSPVLAETFVNLGVGLDYTVLAVGSTSEMDAWKVQDDNAPRGMPNRAYLRMLNAADGFTVTLKEMMGQERYTGIAYLDIGDYVKATAKTYNLQVLDSATGRNLDMLMQQTMDGGAIYTLFVFNSPTASDKVSAVLVQDTAPTSRLGVAYAAGSLANLTLEVDGSTITTTLSPGDRVDVTGLLSGSHSIEVKQGVTTLLSETLHASGQGVYALALFEDGGIVSSSLLENTHVPDGASSGNDGQTGLRVVHLGSGTGAVDVVLTHPSPCLKLPIASNVAYNTVSDNVDVAGLTETYTATVYDAGTANAVYTLTNLLLQPGDNATLYLIDQGGVPVLAYGVDIQMAVNTFAFYEIDAADVGQWQVHLHGDTAGPDNYTLAVDGKRPAPALSNVHIITPSVLEWQLVSPAPDTTIKVFYQTEPITDIFQGRPLSNTLNAPLNPSWTPGSTEPYYDAAWTDGTLQTYTLPLNLLPSGTYYLYLEADSAGGGIARTAVPEALVVTHPWNDPWVAGLALSQEGYGQVTARWNDIGNPEVDEYSLVYASSVTTWTQSAEIQTAQGRTELTVGSLIPGQTYTFTVDVINYREGDTERVAHSESVAVTIEGAVFDLVAPGTPVTAPAGQDIVAVVTLQTALDPYPGVVWLYEGPHSDGIHLDLDTDSFTPTVAGASVPVTISVDASVAQGTYTVTVIGKGGGESSSDVLTVDVTAPSFALQTSESSSTLNENGVVTLTISANRLDGHTAPIWLEVLDSPSALSLLPDEAILVAQTKDLTIADMSYIEGGVYTYTIRGYDGINDVFITQTIEVVKAHYRVTASQSRITATLNASNTIQVPLDVSFAYGWDAPVTLMMGPQYAPPFGRVGFVTTSVPAGENLISLMTLDAPGQVTLHVETLDRTPPGTYIMPVLAESDGLQKEIEIWLRVGEETSPGLPYDIYLPLVLRNS
ncbi:MAG: DUF4397 domain-containing protein, partial [Chloroflexi bacterium]|nr:DUF4397 domain-containing protein [Chloroflexota bacterium]